MTATKMTKIIAMLIGCFYGWVGAQSYQIDGRVIGNFNNEAVTNAEITVLDMSGKVLSRAVSDKSGYFHTGHLEAPWVRIHVTRDSFLTSTFNLDPRPLVSGNMLRLDIELRRTFFPDAPKDKERTKANVATEIQLAPVSQPEIPNTGWDDRPAGPFTVLVKVSPRKLSDSDPVFEKYTDLKWVESDGQYYYTVGRFRTMDDAEHFLQKYIKAGHPTALVWKYDSPQSEH